MNVVPLCQIVPMANHRVSVRIDSREVLCWNFGSDYPRPFFFPVIGPSGSELTRMGHPGAPDHDHHQSIWFAHHKVLGIDFWGNQSAAHIRQLQWLAFDEADDACRMAVQLGWFDGHDPAPLLRQELICELRPMPGLEWTMELQSRFEPVAETLEFDRTNFGFLAVRVARSLSAVFGNGILTSSTGDQTEQKLFEKDAKWMDYSGSTDRRGVQIEGITYMDHPGNPGQPTGWHVRDDGWMCASPCMKSSLTTARSSPLLLRYLLHAHSGLVQPEVANELQSRFAARSPMNVVKGRSPHTRWQVVRT